MVSLFWLPGSLLLFYVLSLLVDTLKVRRSRRRLARLHGCVDAPRLPQTDPILGLDVALQMFRGYQGGNRSSIFKQQHKEFGATFQSMALGKPRIFTISPGNIRTIFTDLQTWGVQPLRLAPWGPLLGAGVMDTDGAMWRISRDLVQPLFRRDSISDLKPFDVHVQRLMQHISSDGSTIDMQPLFAKLILDFTTEFLFGTSVASLTDDPDKDCLEFLKAFQLGQAEMGKRTQLPYLTLFPLTKKFRESCDLVQKFVDKRIDAVASLAEQTKGEKSRKYILVEELVRVSQNKTHIRDQLRNTFLAAHDTTAVLLTNVFFNLARNPGVFQKLRSEILSLPSIPTDADELKKLSYLYNVVRETSRLTPVVGQSARVALHDTILPEGGGESCSAPILVPKGTSVQFNYFALHRQSSVFGHDAEVFRPERWNDLQVGAWDFLPFSGGPRVCPAQQMATSQVCYTVGIITHTFKAIENRDSVLDFVERYRITSDSKNGCKISFSK